MGHAKRMLEDLQAGGFTSQPDLYVCSRCLLDPFHKSLIDSHSNSARCSFCNRRQAACLDVLLENLSDTLAVHFDDATNELPYDGREGGFQGDHFDTDELFEQRLPEWTHNDRLIQAVADSFLDLAWCERDPFGLTEFEALNIGWEGFVREVKERTRYLFFSPPTELHVAQVDGILPQDVLEALGRLFISYNLFATLSPHNLVQRARVVKSGETPCTPDELGTSPAKQAFNPNRMSPAGIPMFYGALEETVAIAETFEPRRGRKREIAMATFRPTRQLLLLNLVQLPVVPSFFDPNGHQTRDTISFLHSFAHDLSKPVKRDGLAHAEYAPTQVVTEFVRHRLKYANTTPIDGILYKSSRCRDGIAMVLFATQAQCKPGPGWGPAQMLELVDVKYMLPPIRRRRARNAC